VIKISQETVLTFLREHPDRYWSAKEIAKGLKLGSVSSITVNLQKLRKTNFIKFKLLHPCNLYKYNKIK